MINLGNEKQTMTLLICLTAAAMIWTTTVETTEREVKKYSKIV